MANQQHLSKHQVFKWQKSSTTFVIKNIIYDPEKMYLNKLLKFD